MILCFPRQACSRDQSDLVTVESMNEEVALHAFAAMNNQQMYIALQGSPVSGRLLCLVRM